MGAINNIGIELVLLPLSFLIFLYIFMMWRRKTSLLTNWPLVGMTPSVLMNAHRIHDFATCILQKSNLTFQFIGPSLANMTSLWTCDPANINHILSKNFKNYPKGPDFVKIFDILGDGILSADGHLWEVQRRTTVSLFNHAQFYQTLQNIAREKLEKRLVPMFDHVSKHGIEVDLLDIFQRLNFDNICSLLLDHDPQSLSLDLPYDPLHQGLVDVQEALLYRHILPESIWKLQSWIGFGKEKKLSKAWECIDEFLYRCISMKRQQVVLKNSEHMSAAEVDDKLDISTAFMEFADKENPGNPDKFLRDTLFSIIVAARDTTSVALSWFFWLLSKNPSVESKILEEINTNLQSKEVKSWMLSNNREELQKLVYLHGALCESLRLYPPVPFDHKSPAKPDILPSGHRVEKDSQILFPFYAMGRMESIWGKDCLEFKPERWITEQGGIKHEPSYKFVAFGAGPRLCVGKDMAFTQMKILATAIIHAYCIQVVENHPVVPCNSVVLDMKYGLKIRVSKRNACLPASVE
ncbi:Alkane hydroxylase mah1 [Heracleum sosnowskyi]|uniref:Alkane hydroxylase mah1 n=1 Tax=Heracleum sosnowskyi TaxID=360622 RepID=A0AAD8IW43_9APIA|nr:Alkane hydroxylase mah1 [Heracleum sosnowskyi]